MLQELKDDVKGAIWTLRFSPCGQYLATAGQDALLRVWQISPDEDVLIQSKLIKKWHGHKGEIVQIAWAPKVISRRILLIFWLKKGQVSFIMFY